MRTFESIPDLRPHLLRDGIAARVVNGERITMAVVDLEEGIVLPEHHHENEQLGFVISGIITMRIGGEKKELHAGETYRIPSNVPHDAVAGPQGCTVTDVFAPVRADWEKLPRSEASPGRWP
ncbi:MAG: cupin domain-containing protein [Candidatus Dormibacteraceae bacterium]